MFYVPLGKKKNKYKLFSRFFILSPGKLLSERLKVKNLLEKEP